MLNTLGAVHPDWANHFRPTVRGYMTCEVMIYRHGAKTLAAGTFQPTFSKDIYFEDIPARIEDLTVPSLRQAGPEPTYVRRIQVQVELPHDYRDILEKDELSGALLEITDVNDPRVFDKGLSDHVYMIHAASNSSLKWHKTLICTTDLKANLREA